MFNRRPRAKVAALAVTLLLLFPCVAHAAAPTFLDLMDPAVFPEAQRGLTVESVTRNDSGVTVVTTGAVMLLDSAKGTITFRQRLAAERTVATLDLGRPMRGVTVTHKGTGFARLTIEQPKATIRINGDSLFMLQAHAPLSVSARSEIAPAWNASWKTNHLVVDELGGFGLYCSDLDLADKYDPYADLVATYPLPANAVLAVGVCPPKPYDWERSLREQVIWHWSATTSYPPDAELRSWKPYGNMVLLQSEVMLWKDWNLDFLPRLGMDEWTRVRTTIHDMGLPFIVYTSPYYFLKGTSQEKLAANDKPGTSPGAVTNGENMDLFLDAITRVMTNLKPDGLYFDGMYSDNPAALYALARHARRIIGETGTLEWHSTMELGPWGSQMYMPQADAYTDIQLRGETMDALYGDFDYLRYFVSGYNINNCIGVLCNNSGKPTAIPQIESVLRANARLHTLIGDTQMRQSVVDTYRPRLTPAYRAEVDRLVALRQQQVRAGVDDIKAFLKGPQARLSVATAFEFDRMPNAEKVISPLNPDALSIVDGCLRIRARGNTYAFLKLPVNKAVTGFEIKLRQGTDRGMSWGPAAMALWEDGRGVRIGARANALQSDVPTGQLIGPPYDPNTWVWVRAQWQGKIGVVEYSIDGIRYSRFQTFPLPPQDHAFTSILIGKVPFSGKAQDHTDPGSPGDCDIDWVRLYTR